LTLRVLHLSPLFPLRSQVNIGGDLSQAAGAGDKKRKSTTRAESWAFRCERGEIFKVLSTKCCDACCLEKKATFSLVNNQRMTNGELTASERRNNTRDYLFTHSSLAPGSSRRSFWFQLENNTGSEVRSSLLGWCVSVLIANH